VSWLGEGEEVDDEGPLLSMKLVKEALPPLLPLLLYLLLLLLLLLLLVLG
jgi:hypothetical protein